MSCLEVCGHGAFSPLKLETAFGDLVQWVETGARPAGDDVLNPTAAAALDFGCTVAGAGAGWGGAGSAGAFSGGFPGRAIRETVMTEGDGFRAP